MATTKIGWAVGESPSGTPLDVLRTDDGGRSFHLRYTAPSGVDVVGIATPSAQDVDILENPCFSEGCGSSTLVASSDGGHTFSTVHTFPDFSAAALSFPDPKDGFIAGGKTNPNGVPSTDGMLYVTHDGGRTWSALSWSSAPFDCPGEAVDGIALQFKNREDGWLLCGGEPGAGQQGKALYRTTDGGAHWSTVVADTFGQNGFSHSALPVDGYVRSLFFVNQNVGYIGLDRGGFLVTRDGGRTWAPAFTSAVPAGSDQAFSVGFLPDGFGWLLGGEGPPLFTTTDQGTLWEQVYPPAVPTNDVAALPGGQAYGLGTFQGLPNLVASNDGGGTWSNWPVLPGGTPTSALQVLAGDTFIVSQYSRIAISQNGGQEWTWLNLPDGFAATALGYMSPGLGWVTARSAQGTALLRCAGKNCSVLTTPFTPTAAIETGPDAGIAVGVTPTGKGAFFSTSDGGSHWKTAVLPSGLRPIGAGVTSYLWWIYSAHHILWSYDHGTSWHEIVLPASQSITSLSFANFQDGLMTTVDGNGSSTLWRTPNGGQTFISTGR